MNHGEMKRRRMRKSSLNVSTRPSWEVGGGETPQTSLITTLSLRIDLLHFFWRTITQDLTLLNCGVLFLHPQSRQSVRLIVRMGPTPSPAGECAPPFGSGGVAHSLAGEGVGWSQSGRGARHCGTLVKYVLCACVPLRTAATYRSPKAVYITI
jgi:hypothetical protein